MPKMVSGAEGIYFVVRLPEEWRLVPIRFDRHPEGGHSDYWESTVTPLLARTWAPVLFPRERGAGARAACAQLKSDLGLYYDGFPRGRVTWLEETHRFALYHGANLKPAMKVSRPAIERAFGIDGRAVWEFDQHEQCSQFSAEALQQLLRLRERWKAVEADLE